MSYQNRDSILKLFRAISMEPGRFLTPNEIPTQKMPDVMAYLSGTGLSESDVLGVYFVDEFSGSISGFVLTEYALYNIGGFLHGSMTERGCTAIPFSKIQKIAITNKYFVGDGKDLDSSFWDMQLYADGMKPTRLHYWKRTGRYLHKERFPIKIREYALAVNEMVKAAQGKSVIELTLDNPAAAGRIAIPEADRTVVASNPAGLFLRFLLHGVIGAAIAQIFIFWILWGYNWKFCFFPIVAVLVSLWLMLKSGVSFFSLLRRGGMLLGGLARVLFIPMIAALCLIPAHLTWDFFGLGSRFARDGAAAASSSPDGMVRLEAGSYMRGLDTNAKVYNMFMTPSHEVTFRQDFYISDHEVTQGEFKAVMGKLPKGIKAYYGKGDDLPVYHASWYMAVAYCNKRSLAEGLTPCYSVKGVSDWSRISLKSVPIKENADWDAVTCDWEADGYRLPTEAEWEYAARAGDNTTDSGVWSGTASEASLPEYAWYKDSLSGKAHKVRTKKANAFGLYDMTGNVWEWCWDWFGAKEYENHKDGVSDPHGPDSGKERIIRGGGWESAPNICAVYSRFDEKAYVGADLSPRGDVKSVIGFRVVRTAW